MCVYWRPGVVCVCVLEAGGSVCVLEARGSVCVLEARGSVCVLEAGGRWVYWRPGGSVCVLVNDGMKSMICELLIITSMISM